MAAMTEPRVMLVAGGTGSIGLAVAKEALAQGWAVVVHGRSPEKTAKLAESLGERAGALAVDTSRPDAAEVLIAESLAIFGRLDAVVDCVSSGPAGYRLTGRFADIEPAGLAPFYDLSAAWFARLAHATYPELARRGGTLIAFVSDAGKFAAPNQTTVGAARAATIGFVRNLAVEAARDGIRAHCISPSFVLESRTAELMGSRRLETAASRAGLGLPTPADIAPMTVFLCGDGAAKITGQVISVNGGLNA
jgi:NAD(P)-dependent dehydrogenase (short-subunit alcohol dehydrogenase family)